MCDVSVCTVRGRGRGPCSLMDSGSRVEAD
jgi:hypothetical protein